MRRSLTPVVVAAAMSLSLPALAQNKPGCPQGAWFCADAEVNVPPAAAQPARPAQPPQAVQPPVVVEEPAQPEPEAQPPIRRPRYPTEAPPPVVIYQPVPTAPPPQVIIITPGYGYGYGRPVRPVPPPPARVVSKRWQPEFGINLRVEGIALGHPGGSAFNAGMGGVGLSLRYRPVPHFAFDFGADVLAGNDYNGFQRMEVPISLNGIFYLNPRSRVQVYLIGGAHVSRAEVRSDVPAPQLAPVGDGSQYGATYTYFGGQGGLGLEFRLSKRIAIDIDGMGFIRKRIGDIQAPEFIDPETGRTTNTSAGGLFRGGLQFWW